MCKKPIEHNIIRDTDYIVKITDYLDKLSLYKEDELNNILNIFIEKENYEYAAKIRDAIKLIRIRKEYKITQKIQEEKWKEDEIKYQEQRDSKFHEMAEYEATSMGTKKFIELIAYNESIENFTEYF